MKEELRRKTTATRPSFPPSFISGKCPPSVVVVVPESAPDKEKGRVRRLTKLVDEERRRKTRLKQVQS